MYFSLLKCFSLYLNLVYLFLFFCCEQHDAAVLRAVLLVGVNLSSPVCCAVSGGAGAEGGRSAGVWRVAVFNTLSSD